MKCNGKKCTVVLSYLLDMAHQLPPYAGLVSAPQHDQLQQPHTPEGADILGPVSTTYEVESMALCNRGAAKESTRSIKVTFAVWGSRRADQQLLPKP